MDRTNQHYHSYTLRLSRVFDTDIWNATLYCAQTGKRHRFGDLAQLYAFLVDSLTEPAAELDPPDIAPES